MRGRKQRRLTARLLVQPTLTGQSSECLLATIFRSIFRRMVGKAKTDARVVCVCACVLRVLISPPARSAPYPQSGCLFFFFSFSSFFALICTNQ